MLLYSFSKKKIMVERWTTVVVFIAHPIILRETQHTGNHHQRFCCEFQCVSFATEM